jgi:putative nucleotidyltransferase with HDIG domain
MIVEDQIVGAIYVATADSYSRFLTDDLMALNTVSNQAAVAMKNAFLYQDIRGLYSNIVRSLAATIDAHDPYTFGHSHRVTANSLVLAESLGLDDEKRNALEIGAYLHDIGKIGIPDSILMKKSTLSKDQIRSVEEHPVVGARILEPVGFDEEVISIVLHHHERVDGRGYPKGLKDDAIPLGARILCVVDSFDAMISNRPYRSKLSVGAALLEIRSGSGTQFDSRVVEEFIEACSEGRVILPERADHREPAMTEGEKVLE